MRIELTRTIDNGIETLGSLSIMDDGNPLFTCVTLELPWKDNEIGESCIPKGIYHARIRHATPAISYEHIYLTDVPHRSGICIHKANFVSELKGCIAVGQDKMDIDKDGQLDVTQSGKTFKAMMKLLPDTFEVEIR